MRSQPPSQPTGPTKPEPPPRPTGPPRQTAEVLYPVSELAELWRCSDQHIYNLIARRELRSIQLGMGRAKTRIPASAAAEFVARRSSKKAKAA
jgi:excisionase family DNA binding protein